jgi:hypothetical protein
MTVGTTHLPATSATALKDFAAFLCLSMLGTDVLLVVGFGITGRLFVDGLLVSAHDREIPRPAGGHKIGSAYKQLIEVTQASATSQTER